jgi:hypothetical protein
MKGSTFGLILSVTAICSWTATATAQSLTVTLSGDTRVDVAAYADAVGQEGPVDHYSQVSDPIRASAAAVAGSGASSASAGAEGEIMLSQSSLQFDVLGYGVAVNGIASAYAYIDFSCSNGHLQVDGAPREILPGDPPYGDPHPTDVSLPFWLTERDYVDGVLIYATTRCARAWMGNIDIIGDNTVIGYNTGRLDQPVHYNGTGPMHWRWEFDASMTGAPMETYVVAPNQTSHYDLGPTKVDIAFGDLAQAGAVSVTNVDVNNPANFQGDLAGKLLAWDINPAQEFQLGADNSAVLTFSYAGTYVDPNIATDEIKLMHWSGSDWIDVTGTVDTVNETITSIPMDSFSPFVMIPEPATLSLLALGALAMLRRRK